MIIACLFKNISTFISIIHTSIYNDCMNLSITFWEFINNMFGLVVHKMIYLIQMIIINEIVKYKTTLTELHLDDLKRMN